MYNITTEIKRLSFFLILIGLVAMAYGFFQSLTVVSDDKIKSTVKKIAKELNLEYKSKYMKYKSKYIKYERKLMEFLYRLYKEK